MFLITQGQGLSDNNSKFHGCSASSPPEWPFLVIQGHQLSSDFWIPTPAVCPTPCFFLQGQVSWCQLSWCEHAHRRHSKHLPRLRSSRVPPPKRGATWRCPWTKSGFPRSERSKPSLAYGFDPVSSCINGDKKKTPYVPQTQHVLPLYPVTFNL